MFRFLRQYHEERDGKDVKIQEYFLGKFSKVGNLARMISFDIEIRGYIYFLQCLRPKRKNKLQLKQRINFIDALKKVSLNFALEEKNLFCVKLFEYFW